MLSDTQSGPTAFEQGKLPKELLNGLVLSRLGARDERVVVGPAVGEDSAIVRVEGERFISASTDPIIGATEKIGHLVVHVNANDVAASGGRPRWFLLTQLFPVGTDLAVVQRISQQVDETCRELDIAIIGGHTEYTKAVDRPILVGTMLGTLLTASPIKTSGARVGDHVVLTKGVGLEGTAILCQDRAEQLVRGGVFASTQDSLHQAQVHANQLSVVRDAQVALAALPGDGIISSMHDPTEGGLAGALHEVADSAGKGFTIWTEKVPISDATRSICAYYNMSPFHLISSGALLLCVHPDHVQSLLSAYAAANIVASDIGLIVDDPKRRSAVAVSATTTTQEETPFLCKEQDALWDALEHKV